MITYLYPEAITPNFDISFFDRIQQEGWMS